MNVLIHGLFKNGPGEMICFCGFSVSLNSYDSTKIDEARKTFLEHLRWIGQSSS